MDDNGPLWGATWNNAEIEATPPVRELLQRRAQVNGLEHDGTLEHSRNLGSQRTGRT